MSSFWALVAPFFATPKNYEQMLHKLAGFAFYETYFITLFLRNIPCVDDTFRAIEIYGKLGKLLSVLPNSSDLNITGIAIALLVALLSHVAKLHDWISNIFGIRHRFDVTQILLPLAKLVKLDLSPEQVQKVAANRHDLMRKVFYRYTSSRAPNPLVDRHDIEHALAQWSWFWVCIEGAAYFMAGAIAALAFGSFQLGFWFLAITGLLVIGSLVQHRRLWKYARPQIAAIASDREAAEHVRAEFSAL